MKQLRKDDSIKVCSFDKGNGVVILDSDDYYQKLDSIVLDKSKFKEIPVNPKKSHPIIAKENSIIRVLNRYVKPFIPSEIFSKIYPSGSQPGKIYGLCKVHKKDHPLRPVVSMIGTAEYSLAKYLDSVIKPCIPDKYMLQSTASFIDRLKAFVFNRTQTLVSFDVVSLFTNVPLKETIDIVCDYVYSNSNHPSYPKSVFKKLMEIATGGYFLYKDKLYCQTDGVTMGSPLGPTLANIFLAHFETKFMELDIDFKPDLYLRYVDDIFCVFQSPESVNKFFELLNSLHPNLEFTHEIGNDCLAFLDTSVSLPDDSSEVFTSKVYRKPTNTNVILNYSALCPLNWKFGLITCFLNRAYIVCSTWSLFHDEISYLKSMFTSNGYPTSIFDNCVNNFISKKISGDGSCEKKEEADGLSFVLCIPYFSHISNNFKKQLRSLLNKSSVDSRIVFKSFRVGSYFSLKNRTPLSLRANVVYHFQCSCDKNLSYIGKTKRHLAVRAKEHLEGRTAISNHLDSCHMCKASSSLDDFFVLASGTSDLDIKIKEALYIKKQKPSLNSQLYENGASFLLHVF